AHDPRRVRYDIDMKRVKRGKLVLGIADGTVMADDKIVYRAKDMKVGLFNPDQM
ncbi:MAG: beta-hydroxydecanoyl-ACP dehydratase, partial [Pseudomonadota bacterium]